MYLGFLKEGGHISEGKGRGPGREGADIFFFMLSLKSYGDRNRLKVGGGGGGGTEWEDPLGKWMEPSLSPKTTRDTC